MRFFEVILRDGEIASSGKDLQLPDGIIIIRIINLISNRKEHILIFQIFIRQSRCVHPGQILWSTVSDEMIINSRYLNFTRKVRILLRFSIYTHMMPWHIPCTLHGSRIETVKWNVSWISRWPSLYLSHIVYVFIKHELAWIQHNIHAIL